MIKQLNNKKFIFIYLAVNILMASRGVQAADIPSIDCMIEPNIMVDISSPVDGVLATLLVDRSDEVKKGAIIATLKSEVEQVTVNMSRERLELSQVKYERAKNLYKKKAITLTEKDQLNNERKLAELDLKHAKANLGLKQIRSPIDGVVVKRFSTPGEFVKSDPIIQMAQLDPLKIEVVSPVSNYGKIVKGMRAKILPDSGGYSDLIAEVVVVDKVIDAASGTFGIRLELANKDHMIPSGLKCKVLFMPEPDPELAVKVTPDKSAMAKQAAVIPAVVKTDDVLMCLTIGPYKEKKIIDGMIVELGADIKHTELRSDKKTKSTYWVMSESVNALKETREVMQSMKDAGIADVAIMKKKGGYRLSLGIYSQQANAKQRVDIVKSKGYKVHIKHVINEAGTYWADILYLPQYATTFTDLIPESHRSACDEKIRLSLLKH